MALEGHNNPQVPDDLCWMAAEPLWSAMAHARTEGKGKTYNVHFRYENDFGVTANLIVPRAGGIPTSRKRASGATSINFRFLSCGWAWFSE